MSFKVLVDLGVKDGVVKAKNSFHAIVIGQKLTAIGYSVVNGVATHTNGSTIQIV